MGEEERSLNTDMETLPMPLEQGEAVVLKLQLQMKHGTWIDQLLAQGPL